VKGETTKRLFRAIASKSEDDILKLCKTVINEERNIGHNNLADQLVRILKKNSVTETNRRASGIYNLNNVSSLSNIKELPRSKRNNDLLANKTPFQELKHHMVLPPEVEARFFNIEKEYSARERLATYGLTHKKKILLYGAPGCGKTLGAERLAFNTGLPLIKIRFDALISSYLGDSASNLRTIFDNAATSPSVLLLDECDFIAKSRNFSNDVGEIPRLVNMLLTLLDEYRAPGLLVATTNLESNLDSALFRRFDDVIEVPPPGKAQGVELLKTSLSSLKIEARLPWSSIADKLKGCSAATFVKLSEEAAKYSILRGSNKVQKEDFAKATSEIYRCIKK